MKLCFDVDCDPGFEVYGEAVLENGDLLNQAADQRLIKLCDGDRLAFDEILQIIFAREKISSDPIDETRAAVISCEESRDFLQRIGIFGQIVHTPSHSADSVSLVLDDGDCFVGDLEPYEYIDAYMDNAGLKKDWDKLMSLNPKKIFYAHRPEMTIN